MGSHRDSEPSSFDVSLWVFKGGVVALLFALPTVILSILNSQLTLGITLFGLPGVAISIVYLLGIRRKPAALIAGALITVTALGSWIWFLVALTDQNLGLGGPFGAYVICLILSFIVAIADALLIARDRRRARNRE